MINNIFDQLKRDEGFRPNIYIDTVGKRTIGYGHNLDANPYPILPGAGISEELADKILHTDVDTITDSLTHHLPWTDTLQDVRFGVLQNMSFNMGVIGLIGFHLMLTYLQYGEFSSATAEMMSSKWYTEVGDRGKRLAAQMMQGVWQ